MKYDTLHFARRLQQEGMEPRLAEALVEELVKADVADLATKADLADIKGEIADLKGDIAALRGMISDLRGSLSHEFHRALWMQSGAIVAFVVALRLFT
jgi:hypothetical protein